MFWLNAEQQIFSVAIREIHGVKSLKAAWIPESIFSGSRRLLSWQGALVRKETEELAS
jgi:hypothetical protein